MLKTIKQDQGEFLFLAGLTIITLYVIYATSSLTRPDSAAVPWVIIAIMVISLVLIFMMKFFGTQIKTVLGISDDGEWMDIGTGEIEEEDQTMFEIDLWGVSKELAWIAGYIFSFLFIGFFTSTIIFINAYIFLKEASNIKRRLAYMGISTGGILAVLYILFIELLGVSAIFRLGFLP